MNVGTLGNIGTLRAFLTLDANQYISSLKTATNATRQEVQKQAEDFRKMHNDLGLSTLGAMALVVPMRQFLNVTQKAFGEFELFGKKIQAVSGRSASEIDRMSASLIAFGKAMGYTPQAMGKTAYSAAQAAFTGKAEMYQLAKSATRLARASGKEITADTAVELSSAILRSFGLGVEKAEELNDVLLKTRDLSKMSIAEISKSVQKSASLFGNFSRGKWKEGLSAMMAVQSVATQAGTTGPTVDTGIRAIIMQTVKESLKKDSPLNAMAGKYGYNDAYSMMSMDFMKYLKALGDNTQGDTQILGMFEFGRREITVLSELLVRDWKEIETTYNSILNSKGTTENNVKLMAESWDMVKDKLMSAYEAFKVSWGKDVVDILRPIALSMTSILEYFENMPSTTKRVILFTGAILAMTSAFKALAAVLRIAGIRSFSGGFLPTLSRAGAGASLFSMLLTNGLVTNPTYAQAQQSTMSSALTRSSFYRSGGQPFSFPQRGITGSTARALGWNLGGWADRAVGNYNTASIFNSMSGYGNPRLTGGRGMGVQAGQYVDPYLFNIARSTSARRGLSDLGRQSTLESVRLLLQKMSERSGKSQFQNGIWGGGGLVSLRALEQTFSNFNERGFLWNRRIFNPSQSNRLSLPAYTADRGFAMTPFGGSSLMNRTSTALTLAGNSSYYTPFTMVGNGSRPPIPSSPSMWNRMTSSFNALSFGSSASTMMPALNLSGLRNIGTGVTTVLSSFSRLVMGVTLLSARILGAGTIIYGIATAINRRWVTTQPNVKNERTYAGLTNIDKIAKGYGMYAETLGEIAWGFTGGALANTINGAPSGTTSKQVKENLSKIWSAKAMFDQMTAGVFNLTRGATTQDYFKSFVESQTKELADPFSGKLDEASKQTIREALLSPRSVKTMEWVDAEKTKKDLFYRTMQMTPEQLKKQFPQLLANADDTAIPPKNPLADYISDMQSEATAQVQAIEEQLKKAQGMDVPHTKIKEYADAMQLGTTEAYNTRLPQYRTVDEIARDQRRQQIDALKEMLKDAKKSADNTKIIADAVMQGVTGLSAGSM